MEINSSLNDSHDELSNSFASNSNSNSIINDCSETKYSSSVMNASQEIYHTNEEVNALLEVLHHIKSKDQESLSETEHDEDIAKLEEISEKLLVFVNMDTSLISFVNEADNLRDTKKYLKRKDTRHFATYNRFVDKEPEVDEYGSPKMSMVYINKLICSNSGLYYRTHELNDILYLHFKGFRQIGNLDSFINLKVLYLESNMIKKIEGLDNLSSLTSLYLQENMIENIEGLSNLKLLNTLNLSDNRIKKIENLGNNSRLNTLLLKRNNIGQDKDDLKGLIELSSSVSVIDISDNKIDDENIVDNYLAKIEGLKVIYMSGNECVRKIPSYRKTLTYKIKELRYIDDKPIFEDERRFAEAFGRGGLEEEKKEREVYKLEKKEDQIKRVRDFQEMVEGWKLKNKKDDNPSSETPAKNLDNSDIHHEEPKNTSVDPKQEMLLRMNKRMQEAKQKQIEIPEKEEKGKKLIIEEESEETDQIVDTSSKSKQPKEEESIPSLEEIKNSELHFELERAKRNLEEKQRREELSKNIVDVRNTHESNSIFEELD